MPKVKSSVKRYCVTRRQAGSSCASPVDRKSTRLNSSHSQISYAVFCLKKKKSTKVRLATSELTQTVRAVSLFARDSANVIRVKAHAGALVLSATTNEVGNSEAEMPTHVEGSEIQIAFNARYVLDALGVIG